MHRPAQAAEELRRAVKELGCCGVILNDWQSTGGDGNGVVMYDGPAFDPFWKAAEELDVPVYFHPKVLDCKDFALTKSGRMNIRWKRFSTRGLG
jgi:2,3-dihydroxybenzoate decarboxylase